MTPSFCSGFAPFASHFKYLLTLSANIRPCGADQVVGTAHQVRNSELNTTLASRLLLMIEILIRNVSDILLRLSNWGMMYELPVANSPPFPSQRRTHLVELQRHPQQITVTDSEC